MTIGRTTERDGKEVRRRIRSKYKGKSIAIPLQARCGPEVG